MGALADRMEQDLVLRGRSRVTITTYLQRARQFVRFHMKSPEEMGEEEIRDFLRHLVVERKAGPEVLRSHIASLKFLFGVTLRRPEAVSWIPWPRKRKRLPEVLAQQEVIDLIAAAGSPRMRAVIMLGYGSGLRISEIRSLVPGDIDSKRGVILVRAGKGNKDRIAPLSPTLLAALRDYWRQTRPRGPYLFPGGKPGQPISKQALHKPYKAALRRAGIERQIGFHALRTAFATHLLESGVDLLTIQHLLGHTWFSSSLCYLRVRTDHLLAAGSPLDRLPAS